MRLACRSLLGHWANPAFSFPYLLHLSLHITPFIEAQNLVSKVTRMKLRVFPTNTVRRRLVETVWNSWPLYFCNE